MIFIKTLRFRLLGWSLCFLWCFSSSLQYLKVTIWCESQSAALLWTLSSMLSGATCDFKAVQNGGEVMHSGDLSTVNVNAPHWLAWARRGNIMSTVCSFSRPYNMWLQEQHPCTVPAMPLPSKQFRHEPLVHNSRAGRGPKMLRPSRESSAEPIKNSFMWIKTTKKSFLSLKSLRQDDKGWMKAEC